MSTSEHCDGCGKRFLRPEDAEECGIEVEGRPEIRCRLCAACVFTLIGGGRRAKKINDRITRRHQEVLIA